MKKTFLILMMMAGAAMMLPAQEPVEMETTDIDSAAIEQTDIDTVAIDQTDTVIPDPDPEWYVAPMELAKQSLAPRRAAANNCPIDSVLTFDVDSNLIAVTVYEYGDTLRTLTWAVNPDGSRVGQTREDTAYTSEAAFHALYEWDDLTNDWKGTEKTNHKYVGSKETVRITYAWANNTWSADTKYTWEYDASGRETAFVVYIFDTSINDFIYSKARYQSWHNNGKKAEEIQYTSYTNGAWSAGDKKVWNYNASGKQTLYEYYSSYNNGSWIGSSKEVWGYDSSNLKNLNEKYSWSSNDWLCHTREIWENNGPSNKQTYYEKKVLSSSTWIGSAKESWEYNGPSNEQTLHEKYGWANGDWSLNLQEISDYNPAGNKTLAEKHEFKNNKWTRSKTEYLFNESNASVGNITYKWSDGWVKNKWTVNNTSSNPAEKCAYLWTNGEWVGTGTRTLETNSGGKVTETVKQTWSSTTKDWVNSERSTKQYSGTRTIQEASYVWSADINEWVGTSRSDWHYNAAGKEDTIKTYRSIGTEWVDSLRTTKTYNTSGTLILTNNEKWNIVESKWVMQTMTRIDIIDNTIDGVRQVMNATWYCLSDTIWKGSQKDTASYLNADINKPLFLAHSEAWENNDWVPYYKVEYEYDEDGRKTLEQRFDWRVNAWQGNYRNEFGYDEKGRPNMNASYTGWNSSTQNWIGNTKTEKKLNDDNLEIESILSVWGTNDWRQVFRYTTVYSGKKEKEKVTEHYENGQWVYTEKTEKDYVGDTQVKGNTFKWLNDQWVYSTRNETYYDEDAQAKLRREIHGSWNEGVVQSFADYLYSYDCDHPYFTIRFENYDGTLLQSSEIKETKKPVYKGEMPTKPATAQYTYSFKGWSPAIVAVTGDAVYTAEYDSVVNSYRITWLDADDAEVGVDSLEYGAMPSHEDVVKANTAEWTYTFVGWSPAIVAVTGDATYKAQLDSVRNSYRITWLDADDAAVAVDSLAYGAMPSHEDVVKANTAEWTYSFAGWTPAIVAVTGDATYKAQLDSVRNSYRITWLDADDAEVAVDSLAYGAMPSHEDVVKANTAEWTYSFAGWTPAITSVTGDATYKAQLDSVRNGYRITWLDADDAEVGVDSLAYGAMPSHEAVVKANTAEWTYTFVGWSPAITTVTGDATYKAQLDSVRNTYRITWLDADDAEVGVDSLAYCAMPSHEDVVKANTAEWTYSFAGWSPAITTVTGDATYKAQLDSVRNSYRIVWLDADDAEVGVDSLEYGAMPSHEDVVKANTAEWTYTFVGWSPAIVAVTGDATYKAQLDSVRNRYLITFVNGEQVLQSTDVAYGETPTYSGETPTKAATAQYTYNFKGWTPEIVSVAGVATYAAEFDSTVNAYLISFVNGEQVLQSTDVAYGETPAYSGETPTKAATAQYTYNFKGWTPEIVPVAGVATYVAEFDSTVNAYLITFVNGEQVLQSSEVAYGETPEYAGETPTKAATAQYTYTFKGWSPEIVPVVGVATYMADFDSVVNTYTITFYYDNGVTVLDQQVFEYGQMPSTIYVPGHEADAQYSYTFTGWSPELVPVTCDASYIATFEAILNQYTVIFKNYNGRELQSTKVDYGTMPEYTGETPTKAGNAQYSYVFIGWTPELDTVKGDITYTAVFEQVVNTYTVIFYDEDVVTVLDSMTVEYGTIPSTDVVPTKEDDEEYTYTFAGWTPKIVSVTKNASYTATYTATRKTEGLWDVEAADKAQKVMINGVFYILRGDKKYTMDGTIVE